MLTTKFKKLQLKLLAWRRLNIALWIAAFLAAFFMVLIVIPGVLVERIVLPTSLNPAKTQVPGARSGGQALDSTSTQSDALSNRIAVPVYLAEQKTIETIPLEDYVRGVLAAEMPIDFELEALKAQALAARTYVVRRMVEQDTSQVPVEGAIVTDTVSHQVYLNDQTLAERWKDEAYARNMAKLNQAVEETRDMIITYEGKPINATFFSTSNGYTENAEDVWPFSLPYLKSVRSPWDAQSPRFTETVTFAYGDLLKKLGVSSISTNASDKTAIRVLEYSEGRRVKKVMIGGKSFAGTDVREKLGLKSTHFEWKWEGSGKKAKLHITTYGYGHGVGMSQWGANGLAENGRSAEEIIRYYYQGVTISKASNIAIDHLFTKK